MSLLVFYCSLAVFASFFCSLLESVILSAPYSHVQAMSRSGIFYAPLLEKLKSQISVPLSAILTVNTIANTLGAAGAGAQVHKIYGSEYVALGAAVLTFIILVFSEIIPKTLGATYWRSLLPFAVYAIRGLVFVCAPFVAISRYMNKFFGTSSPRSVTREDLIGAAELGAREGGIYKNEGELLKNILKLKNKKVHEIMTPRPVITAFEKNISVGAALKKHQPLRFARIPVYEGSLDQVIGMVHRYKILEAGSQGRGKIAVGDYLKPLHSVPETMSVTAALDQFIKRKEHIFIVVDEYGTVSGLVTMEDVVETILGIEIVDELDPVADLREQALKQWKQKKSRLRKNH